MQQTTLHKIQHLIQLVVLLNEWIINVYYAKYPMATLEHLTS